MGRGREEAQNTGGKPQNTASRPLSARHHVATPNPDVRATGLLRLATTPEYARPASSVVMGKVRAAARSAGVAVGGPSGLNMASARSTNGDAGGVGGGGRVTLASWRPPPTTHSPGVMLGTPTTICQSSAAGRLQFPDRSVVGRRVFRQEQSESTRGHSRYRRDSWELPIAEDALAGIGADIENGVLSGVLLDQPDLGGESAADRERADAVRAAPGHVACGIDIQGEVVHRLTPEASLFPPSTPLRHRTAPSGRPSPPPRPAVM